METTPDSQITYDSTIALMKKIAEEQAKMDLGRGGNRVRVIDPPQIILPPPPTREEEIAKEQARYEEEDRQLREQYGIYRFTEEELAEEQARYEEEDNNREQ